MKRDTRDDVGTSAVPPEGQRRLWIVYKQYPAFPIERVAAYFDERKARAFAASIVGDPGRSLIGIECIPINDDPI